MNREFETIDQHGLHHFRNLITRTALRQSSTYVPPRFAQGLPGDHLKRFHAIRIRQQIGQRDEFEVGTAFVDRGACPELSGAHRFRRRKIR